MNNTNKALYGLRTSKQIRIKYDVKKKLIEKVEGAEISDDDLECSICEAFNVPACIYINGIPYFPTKYEIFNSKYIYYTSRKPPQFSIRIKRNDFLNERAKVRRRTITLEDLNKYDKKRPRVPSQNKVMKESAYMHVQRLIDAKALDLEEENNIHWHWCHLIAFSMLPAERAQHKSNLFCGTAASNGHMANVECAVKLFIYKFKRPLSIEVTATYLAGTHLAKRIRYRIYEKKSGMCISEYFDALTVTFSDYADFEVVYNKLESEYKRSSEMRKLEKD